MSSAREWLAGFREYYWVYARTRVGVHAAATAALTLFGLLMYFHRGFIVLAIASYVLPPIYLYHIGDDPETAGIEKTDGDADADFDGRDIDTDGTDADADSDGADFDADADGIDIDTDGADFDADADGIDIDTDGADFDVDYGSDADADADGADADADGADADADGADFDADGADVDIDN